MNRLLSSVLILLITTAFTNTTYAQGSGDDIETFTAKLVGGWKLVKLVEENGDIELAEDDEELASIRLYFGKDHSMLLDGSDGDMPINGTWRYAPEPPLLYLIAREDDGEEDMITFSVVRITDKTLVIDGTETSSNEGMAFLEKVEE